MRFPIGFNKLLTLAFGDVVFAVKDLFIRFVGDVTFNFIFEGGSSLYTLARCMFTGDVVSLSLISSSLKPSSSENF